MAARGGATNGPVARSRASTRSMVLAERVIPSRRQRMRSFSRPHRRSCCRRSRSRVMTAAGVGGRRPWRGRRDRDSSRLSSVATSRRRQRNSVARDSPKTCAATRQSPVCCYTVRACSRVRAVGDKVVGARPLTRANARGHATELQPDLLVRPVVANSVSHVSDPIQ
jgi:hypothetical protein